MYWHAVSTVPRAIQITRSFLFCYGIFLICTDTLPRLAYCELYVTLGTFFHRFPSGLKVYKTTEWDMEYDDFFSSYHIEGRNWFRAVGTED